MKLLKTLPILLLILLTACDRGSRNPTASCENLDSSTLGVEGFNDDLKSTNRELQALYSLFPETTSSAIGKNDQAKKCIKEEIEKDETKSEFMKIAEPFIRVIMVWVFEVPFWLIVGYLIFNIPRLLHIWMAKPKLEIPSMGETEELRYPAKILRLNAIKIALCFILLIPAGYFKLGGDNVNLYVRLFTFTPVFFGYEQFTYGISNTIAAIQKGNLESSVLSEEVRNDSQIAFYAKMMTDMMVKGKLRDNRTAKAEYYEAFPINGKYTLPVEHPSSMQYIFPSKDKIELKRYTIQQDDKNKQKVRSQLSYNGRVTFSSTTTSNEALTIIATNPSQYLITDASQTESKAEALKNAMITKYGQEILQKPEVINKAVVELVKQSRPALIEKQLIAEDESSTQVARGWEEMSCIFPSSEIAREEIKKNNSQFIKRVAAGDYWGGQPLINRCVGQKGNSYVSYGERPLNVVSAETDSNYKALFDRNYAYLVSIVASTKGITIDNKSEQYCQKARNGGLFASILYFNKCHNTNIVQRELTDSIFDGMAFEAVGFDHYIDTEFRKNDNYYMGTANFKDDFDPLIESTLKTVPIKVTFGDVSQENYMRAIANTYSVEEASEDSIFDMFLSPIQTLKNKLSEKTKEDPLTVKEAFTSSFVKGIKVGTYLLGAGLGASAVDNALEINKNKTSKTDTGYSGKGTSKVTKLMSGFMKIIAASMWVGVVLIYACGVGLLYFGMAKLVFGVIAISYFASIIFSILNSTFELKKFFNIDDENNFIYHAHKIHNKFAYFILSPALIFFLFITCEVLSMTFMIQMADVLINHKAHSFGEAAVFMLLAVVSVWSVKAIVLELSLKAKAYFDKELFGIDEEEDAGAKFVHNTCTFIIKWSLPILGSLLFKIFQPKK